MALNKTMAKTENAERNGSCDLKNSICSYLDPSTMQSLFDSILKTDTSSRMTQNHFFFPMSNKKYGLQSNGRKKPSCEHKVILGQA